MDQEYQEIDLRELLHIVLAKWWLILIFLVLSTVLAAYITISFITPMYEAKSTLFIGKESDSIAGISFSDLQVDNKLVVDYRELIKTRLVTEEVIGDLNLDISVNEFIERLSVTTIKDSRFIHITFQDSNPKTSAMIANKLSATLVDKAVDVVGVENVMIVDHAIVPQGQVSPNLKMNVTISGMLGIMLGLFCVFLLHMLDNTVKREEDIEKHLGLSVLGVVPLFDGEERSSDKKKFNFN